MSAPNPCYFLYIGPGVQDYAYYLLISYSILELNSVSGIMSGQPLLDDDTQPSIDLSNQPESVILVTDSVQSTIEIQSESDNLLQQCSNNKLYGLNDSDIGNCEVVVEHRETADSNNLLQQCLNDSDIVNCEVVIERKDIVGSNNLLQQCSDLTKEKDTSHSDQMHSVVMSIEQVNDEANPDSDDDIVIVYENVYGGIDKLPKFPKNEPVKPENLSTEENAQFLIILKDSWITFNLRLQP